MAKSLTYFEDFCIAGANYSGDAFFLDTNTIISFVDANHSYHLSTVIHLSYMIQKNAKLFISETIVSEALNVLSRLMYAKDTYQAWIQSAAHHFWKTALGRTPTPQDYQTKQDEIRYGFTAHIVKNSANHSLLRKYNEMAANMLDGIVESGFFRLSNTTWATMKDAMGIAVTVPLQSNDALVVAAAIKQNAKIITFDGDLTKDPTVDILKAKGTDSWYKSNFRAHIRMDELDSTLWQVVQHVVSGQSNFHSKFGPRPKFRQTNRKSK